MRPAKLHTRAARLFGVVILAAALAACDDGDDIPRVSSPDWSDAQDVAGLEVRGRLAMLATTFAPVAEVRLRNTGGRTVRAEVGSGACAIELRGYADRGDEVAVWEPQDAVCPPATTEPLELEAGDSETISLEVPLDPQLHSVLRRYRWIVVVGRVRIDDAVVEMELGELLR